MLGFTGTYKGAPVSVQGSGMGVPSIQIYATELIQHFGVEREMLHDHANLAQVEQHHVEVVTTQCVFGGRDVFARGHQPLATGEEVVEAFSNASIVFDYE